MAASTCYNVVVFGEPGVGKTCFIDQFCYGRSFVAYDPDNSGLSHKIVVGGRVSNLALIDLSTAFLKPDQGMHPTEWAEKMLAEADGVVLLYDVTDLASLGYITEEAYSYLWACRKSSTADAERDERESFGCVLVGNKQDLVATGERISADSQTLACEWAQTQGFKSIGIDSLSKAGPQSALELLVKDIQKLERLGLLQARAEELQEGKVSYEANKGSIRNTLRIVLQPSRS
ncbi:hypothetical protein OPT61_g4853 [Boeremia exigua]|uniref:Uncharacterized protein n=1 Tax=Boeremia exigua TaxID=749465 RepID=A0ACC2ICG8_9PLEO|nr:hypothetical protein OPT61_g4853 [Boeremia exigua]